MQILIYSYNYQPEPIGIAPLLTELAEGLVKRGHEVRVVTGMPNYPQRQIYEQYRGKLYLTEVINGVTVQRSYLWIRPQPNLIDRLLLELSFVLTSLGNALRGKHPDVILLTSPPLPVVVPAAFLGWICRCPVILNLQDILPDAAVHIGLLKNPQLIRIFEYLEKFAYRVATKITVIADAFVDNLLSKGVPEHKIELIPNWVDVNFIHPMPKDNDTFSQLIQEIITKEPANNEEIICQKEQLNKREFFVLYSGNIACTQGIETLIYAAVRLRHIPEIAIVIFGEEKALHNLQILCKTCKADNVILLKLQPRERLPKMLAAADVGVVIQKQNVISFNMPSKIQVLLASGRAIIGSIPPNGPAARAIQNSGGGIVIPPEDPGALASAILELYENPDRVKELGENSRKYAIKHYAFEQALDQYEKLFAAVKRP